MLPCIIVENLIVNIFSLDENYGKEMKIRVAHNSFYSFDSKRASKQRKTGNS